MPNTIRATAFDPSIHGFHFRNRFSGNGILNDIWSGLGDTVRRVGGSQGFWDRWGLCGGMTWHALDLFNADIPVPVDVYVPESGSELHRTLLTRQLQSFVRGALIYRCLEWQARSETKSVWVPRRTTRQLTLESWAPLKSSIDNGEPVSLTLIRTRSIPWHNHQVLAVDYQEDTSARFARIGLYDPNHPDTRPTITLTLAGPSAGTAQQSTGEPLRGFFVWPYKAE